MRAGPMVHLNKIKEERRKIEDGGVFFSCELTLCLQKHIDKRGFVSWSWPPPWLIFRQIVFLVLFVKWNFWAQVFDHPTKGNVLLQTIQNSQMPLQLQVQMYLGQNWRMSLLFGSYPNLTQSSWPSRGKCTGGRFARIEGPMIRWEKEGVKRGKVHICKWYPNPVQNCTRNREPRMGH